MIPQFEDAIFQVESNVTTAKRKFSQAADQAIAEVRKREQEAIMSMESTRATRLDRINFAMEEA